MIVLGASVTGTDSSLGGGVGTLARGTRVALDGRPRVTFLFFGAMFYGKGKDGFRTTDKRERKDVCG